MDDGTSTLPIGPACLSMRTRLTSPEKEACRGLQEAQPLAGASVAAQVTVRGPRAQAPPVAEAGPLSDGAPARLQGFHDLQTL